MRFPGGSTSTDSAWARCAIALNFLVLGVSMGCSDPAAKRTPPTVAGAAAVAGGPSRFDSERVLNVYSWADYIAPDTVRNFERETGIEVHYDTYDNNEVLETKLLTGHTHYDVVTPTAIFFDRQRRAGLYRVLDKAALPHLAAADPEILRRMAAYDPGNAHAVPYMWSTVGLGYNVEALKRRLGPMRPDGWGLLLDPRNAAKLADCGITIVDSPMDVFASAIIYLGRDPNRLDPRDVADASAALGRIRPYVRYIDPAQHIPDLANGSICLALTWSGDLAQARSRALEANTGVVLDYLLPREGSLMSMDMMGIPIDAPHPHNAEVWLDYLMRPEVMASITNSIHYANGYAASLPFVAPSIKSDAAIYPDGAARAHLISPVSMSLDYSRLITREWTRFRTGY